MLQESKLLWVFIGVPEKGGEAQSFYFFVWSEHRQHTKHQQTNARTAAYADSRAQVVWRSETQVMLFSFDL